MRDAALDCGNANRQIPSVLSLGTGLVLLAALSSEPQATVVISKTTTVPAAEVERVADAVADALTAGGVRLLRRAEAQTFLADAGVAPTSECAGKFSCLGAAAEAMQLQGVVGVFVTEVVGEKTAFLSLVKRAEDKATLQRDFLFVPEATIGRAELGDFVEASKAILAPPQIILTEAPPKDHTSASIVAGTGAATLVAGIVVGALGVVNKSRFDGLLNESTQHTYAELQAAAAPANTLPAVGIGLGIAAALLGGVAFWLW